MMRVPWYVPSACAAIFCCGITIGNIVTHHYGWAALDAALVLLNVGVLYLLARQRRERARRHAEWMRFLQDTTGKRP